MIFLRNGSENICHPEIGCAVLWNPSWCRTGYHSPQWLTVPFKYIRWFAQDKLNFGCWSSNAFFPWKDREIPLVFILVLEFAGLSKTTDCVWWVDWTEPMGNAAKAAVTKLTFISFKSTQIRPVPSKTITFVDASSVKCALLVLSQDNMECPIWLNPRKKKWIPRN